MHAPREELLVGLDRLAAVTALHQRIRRAHPTAGLYESGDPQWWWGQRARPTDDLPQPVWFDDDGPAAAVLLTAVGDTTRFDAVALPDADPAWVAHVVGRGLAHAAAAGIDRVTTEVARGDDVRHAIVTAHGFAVEDDGVVETWLDLDDRPAVSPLADGYRLASRAETAHLPHPMASEARGHPDPEPRLRQTSLYRDDLDLAVLDGDDRVAAYGLFWCDPTTATGLVEPMRTEDAHQRRGLARHVLTAGLARLAAAGVRRVKICFEPGNPASGHLYLSAGFVPDRRTDVWAGPTRSPG